MLWITIKVGLMLILAGILFGAFWLNLTWGTDFKYWWHRTINFILITICFLGGALVMFPLLIMFFGWLWALLG